ncbi:hypothetical protein [Sedimentibacter sp. MB31-C6]|uniref:hypothetical protein n=1 Tax=Sedimentibacter sp. MB31-C6 TaxID=3109366 RepID=UPI002DDD32DD|nr:hypothetical protein [Sedimentibacter sp. MB36-C1]WSI04737.1 hypothetical protein U8307_02835 [Sedimentibacter sp. MB36-C1]
MISKLSGATRGITSGLLTDPHSIENLISFVRVTAPLASTQTVSKVNTYLPTFEKMSTLLGMYSFLNRAQNYAPIEPISGSSAMDKVSALIKNGNIPIGKMVAKPLLSNNMEKMMSEMAMEMFKNGNFNDILSTMANQFNSNQNSEKSNESSENNNMDFSSLIETFMPLLNNMTSNSTSENEKEINEENDDYENDNYQQNDNEDMNLLTKEIEPEITELEIENLEYDESSYDKNQYPQHENNKPIRIKQRRRRL